LNIRVQFSLVLNVLSANTENNHNVHREFSI